MASFCAATESVCSCWLFISSGQRNSTKYWVLCFELSGIVRAHFGPVGAGSMISMVQYVALLRYVKQLNMCWIHADPTVAADAAWLRPAIAFAHGCLLFFSIVKIIIGALWVKPYTGVVMSFFGCVGVVMAAMYTAYCYFAHRPGRGEGVVAKFFSTPTQLIVVRALTLSD